MPLASRSPPAYDYANLILKKAGYHVVWAKHGQEAVDKCREDPGLALILMDIKMPGMDGLTATRLIRGFNSEIPVIALSAYSMPGDLEKATSAGCSSYLSKPVGREELLLAVQSYL